MSLRRRWHRRMSQTTATVPARPPPGLQPVARPRWFRLGCVSYDAAARPPRQSLIVARSRRALLLTSSATSLRVAVHPRAAALAAPLLVRAALPAPRQLRHYASPLRRRRGMTSSNVIIYNFYSYYTPFQSARQPSEIINSPSHIF